MTGNGTVSSSASSSRNNSPRPLAEAKLRAGVTNRNIAHLQQRNSVNYTSSTLQEDLMKLINPDYMMSSDDNFHQGVLYQNKPSKNSPNSHSLGNISNLSALKPAIVTDDLLLMRKKSRSREGINLGSHGLPISSDAKLKNENQPKNESDVIFTTARPATVISSSANEKQQNELHINEDHVKMSPRRLNSALLNKRKEHDNLMQQPLPLLPDSKEVDWTTLVDQAIMQVNEGLKMSKANKQDIYDELNNGVETNSSNETNPSPPSISPSSSSTCSSSLSGSNSLQQQLTPSTSLPELQNQVTQLEDRITKETRRRKSLEQAVRRLTEENRRLQDESQAAVQQLRRFTEWFFQTIDRQS